MTNDELHGLIALYASEQKLNLLTLKPVPKSELKIGKEYDGICRNSYKAIWNGEKFEYNRVKFGMEYMDQINHYEDDDGYDVFIPIIQS